MAILEWATGDTITKISANNKGIRKGTEAELAAIVIGEREDGDYFWNINSGFFGLPQIQMDAAADDRSNLNILIAADATEVSISSPTPTQVKDVGFIKDTSGFSGNQLTIIARLKQSGGGTTTLIMEVDGGPTDEITLVTTGGSYSVKVGFFDASGLGLGHHTLEFYLSNSTNTGDLELLEVWGI